MINIKLKGESSIGLSNDMVEMSLELGTIDELIFKLNIHSDVLKQIMVIINGKIVHNEAVLKDGDEVLLHLPVTGG